MSRQYAITRNGLADQVVARVRELVRKGTYKPGDRLPAESALCAMFSVGRSTLREAIRVLASRGIVIVRHGDGTYVGPAALIEPLEERLGRARLNDLYEARLALEVPFAELAAQRRDARDVAAMRRFLKARAQAAKAGDVAAYGESDFSFHLAVAKAARSPALYDVYASFLDVVRAQLTAAIRPEYLVTENDPLHDELCEAIARGDVTVARRLARKHLQTSRKNIAARL
jgi:DNA-binding FadR family transcriptional regulator